MNEWLSNGMNEWLMNEWMSNGGDIWINEWIDE